MDRRSRPLPFAIGLAVFAAAALLLVEWPLIRAWYHPPRLNLPAPEQIIQMRATVWAAGSRGNLETDVPWFDLPVTIAQRLWRRFEPSHYVSRPPVNPGLPLGELAATTDDGHVTRLWFFETGADELVFTTDGERFFRSEPRDEMGGPLGGGLLLAGTLRHAAGLGDPPGPGLDHPDSLSIR